MLKLTAIVSLMLIATWSQVDSRRQKKEATASEDYDTGSTLWAAGLSCDSCGSECASACGTRHFRSCCFNYLRRKRGNEVGMKFWPQPPPEIQSLQTQQYPNLPLVVMDNQNVPEPWMQPEYKPYHLEDTLGNRVHVVYDV